MRPIGIDLGTANSVVCEYVRGEARTIDIEGQATVPSIVYLDGGTPEVGRKAKRRVLMKPDQVLTSTKRVIGTNWSKEIQGRHYTPVDAACFVLAYLKEQAEAALNDTIRDVVVTVPAYFNDDQRRDTKLAAEKAGLNVLRLLPEPTAAAIAYGFDRERDQVILVFDLGGGTFDVSILEVQQNDFTVKAVDGNHMLGGDDFDNVIVEYLNQWIEDNNGTSVRTDNVAQQKLKDAAEEAKIALSERLSTDLSIPTLNVDIDRFTRKEFEALIQPYLDEMLEKTRDVIRQAGLTEEDLNRIVLVGGSSKIPVVEEQLTRHFKQPFRADDMDIYVAKGAALVCASMAAPTAEMGDMMARPVDLSFKDVIPHSLGVDFQDRESKKLFYVPILKKNTHYPCKGAALGVAIAWQEMVRMNIYRGEEADPKKNTHLGEVTLDISRENRSDYEVPVSAIFDLDKDGILTLTQAEMPLNTETVDDMEPLVKEAEMNNNLIPWEDAKALIDKHGFKTKTVTVKAV